MKSAWLSYSKLNNPACRTESRSVTTLKSQDYCFVLWADRFDEAAAAIFVTELRKAGLKTSLVRATGQRDAGAYGLALVPDLSLDEARALATHASCVVIPCQSPAVKQLHSDPRVGEFLDVARAAGARLVIGQEAEALLAWHAPLFDAVTRYSQQQSVLRVARRLAHQLAESRSRSRRSRSPAHPA